MNMNELYGLPVTLHVLLSSSCQKVRTPQEIFMRNFLHSDQPTGRAQLQISMGHGNPFALQSTAKYQQLLLNLFGPVICVCHLPSTGDSVIILPFLEKFRSSMVCLFDKKSAECSSFLNCFLIYCIFLFVLTTWKQPFFNSHS